MTTPLKKHIKTGITLLIEADGNLYTLIIRLSKKQMISALDKILPDGDETKTG